MGWLAEGETEVPGTAEAASQSQLPYVHPWQVSDEPHEENRKLVLWKGHQTE